MNRFLALSIAIVILPISIAHASVRITEINWMGSSESQFAEWFELYNDGADAVNLSAWGLYEDGGGQLIFTLTKSISAQGHLLVERTTATSPDPVPGVNDESGPFSGSGFSNSGESLVLKDAGGTIMQNLDFSSGWPAGDATTKQTMQWDGAKWVTAPATPKAPLHGGGTPPPVETSSSGTAWIAPKTTPHIELSIPKTIYVSVASEYYQKTFLEYGEAYSGIFLWNMGDGTIYRNNNSTEISHTYKYPGVYTITFAYYKTPYDSKPFLFESQEHSVVSSTVSLRTISGKGFEFTNSGSVPVDISSWVIILSDTIVELPPFTIIAPKKTVLMPFSVFGIGAGYTQGTLQTPQRVIIDNNTEVQKKVVASSPNVTPVTVQPSSRIPQSISVVEASAIGALPENQENGATKPQTKLIVFAVVLVTVIGFFVLLERFIGSRVEE